MQTIGNRGGYVALTFFETKSDNKGITCTHSKYTGGKIGAEEDAHPVILLVPGPTLHGARFNLPLQSSS